MMNYFRRLIDNNDTASSKRFLGLVMSAYLILASIVLLFASVPNANAGLLDRVLLYAFLIILMSLFGLAVESVARIVLQVNKTKAAAQILTPQPTVTQVDNVEGDIKGNTQESTKPDDTMNNIKKSLAKSLISSDDLPPEEKDKDQHIQL